jgi:hypothetical protein
MPVENTPENRLRVLKQLGHEVFDFDLFKGYLLLEESSAERIIRDLLIPEFTPSLLGKLKTISCRGVTNVSASFEDFLRLFVFIHSAPAYKGKAWVLVDGGERENHRRPEIKVQNMGR